MTGLTTEAVHAASRQSSKHAAAQAHEVADKLDLMPPQMEQPEYNLFKRDRCV